MHNDTERLNFVLYNPDMRVEQSGMLLYWSVWNQATGETLAAEHNTARAAIDEAIDAAQGEQAAEKGGDHG